MNLKSFKTLIFLIIFSFSLVSPHILIEEKVSAGTQHELNDITPKKIKSEKNIETAQITDDVMEDIMEGISDDISEDIGSSIKSEVKEETNEVLGEDISSPFSGTYINMNRNATLQTTISGSTYTVSGGNIFGTVSFTGSGTIDGNIFSGSAIRTVVTGPPTNFPANCTAPYSVSGFFTGDGSPGTKRTVTVSAACFIPANTGVWTKQ